MAAAGEWARAGAEEKRRVIRAATERMQWTISGKRWREISEKNEVRGELVRGGVGM
jgi:hypothetical protein